MVTEAKRPEMTIHPTTFRNVSVKELEREQSEQDSGWEHTPMSYWRKLYRSGSKNTEGGIK